MSTPGDKWLRPILKPIKGILREVLAISLFVNLIALSVPIFVLQIYDRVVFHGGLSTLKALALGMIIALVFDFILRQARARILQKSALKVDILVGNLLYDKLAALPLKTLEARPTHFWQALFRDIETVRNTFSGGAAVLLTDIPFLFLFFGLVFIIAPPVAWVLLVMFGLFLALAGYSSLSVGRAVVVEKEAATRRDAMISEMVAGRVTVKALALDRALHPGWDDRRAETILASLTRGQQADSAQNLGATMAMITTVAVTSVGALAIMEQQMTIGALVAANILGTRFVGPLVQLVGMWKSVAGYREAVRRLGGVFAEAEERTDTPMEMPRPTGRLAMDKVNYRYSPDGPPVLNDITLRFGPSGMHGIVGHNGSGKTTLLKILQGLYPPDSGRVLLDGGDITQFSRHQIADWIGYVPQESFLFSGSIRTNIAIKNANAPDDVILAAAVKAGVHAYAVDMPDGYDTDVGEAGSRLSGGQRQRIAIARALLSDPPILLLDEPTGNLDRQAEQSLREQLQLLAKDHTIIVVTHSPSLLAACDSVMVMQSGQVAMAGASAEVLPKLFNRAPETPATEKPTAGDD
ncbi:MAG: peptidase domain-containing ABC transporter [Rhodospirillaceae bacterium]|nr:peptidase domain-containing ABC transporter [Rhodospirillaceae bacterium]